MAPYTGLAKLVISIDVGATNSAVAYQHLQPNTPVPKPMNVANWPGAQSVHYVKTPSYILYRDRKPIAYGLKAVEEAEFLGEDVKPDSGDILVKNFKLIMHPEWMQKQAITCEAADLPEGVNMFEKPLLPRWLTINKIYQDYISFLLQRTKEDFISTRIGGQQLWDGLISTAEYVIGAPNGWGITEKTIIKKAVAAAAQKGHVNRVTAVSEGETSLHYLINCANQAVPLEAGALFTICDAGGSTVDITLYRCLENGAHRFVEVGAADCLQKGGIYPSRHLHATLKQAFLRSDKFAEQAELLSQAALAEFEATLKTKWDGSAAAGDQRIKFSSSMVDTDATANIRAGRLAIPGADINTAFDTSVKHIIERLKTKLQDEERNQSRAICLVGGYGDSPYLQRALREAFQDVLNGIPVIIASATDPGVKAVSAGGIWLSLHSKAVEGRGAIFDYGQSCDTVYKPWDPEHAKRDKRDVYVDLDGERRVKHSFYPLIKKGEVSSSDDYKYFYFHRSDVDKAELNTTYADTIYVYEGETPTRCKRDVNGRRLPGFRAVGYISYDATPIKKTYRVNKDGGMYWHMDYKVGVAFGAIEIKARVESIDGSFKSMPAVFKTNDAGF